MVGAAADEVHHLSAVAPLEAKHVEEERGLVRHVGAVEHHMRELGWPRAIVDRRGMAGDVGRYAERMAPGRAHTEAVAPPPTRRPRLRVSGPFSAPRPGLPGQAGAWGAVWGPARHAQ